tara:strand:+ start:281 stop:1522 length:1242 start_codon:yes stop_codon:yes gene_type:complete
MEQIFNFDLGKISNLSEKEMSERKKSLDFFLESGFPNKKDENWKFTDLNSIISKNFNNITNNLDFEIEKKINFIQDFEHNFIITVNGSLKTSDMKFEEKGKIKIENFNKLEDFKLQSNNNLFHLNKALSSGGYDLEIRENYKCKKPIVIYNYFTSKLDNKIINNSNKITLKENTELILIEYNINEKSKFLKNTFEKINIFNGSILKNISIQKNKCKGYFYKNISCSLGYNASYQNFLMTSGLKFNKVEIDMNFEKENSNCFILSGLNLKLGEHQEIKSRINHLAPNCKSFQKIKNVLENDSVGIYQGKIYVKDVAQKTDAYQLSKALILDDLAEFNAKPELEIYADDVKCSHGSSSGSIDLDAIHYLMTRGIELSNAKKLLINGFLSEIFENIPEQDIKTFLEKTIEDQINGN